MKTQTNTIRLVAGAAVLLAALGAGLPMAQAKSHGKGHAQMHARISAAQANAIVLKRYPGKLAGKTTLENEEGSWQYGVMVRSGRTLREVMVDANSGKIANVEVTTGAKERVEKREDEAKARDQKSKR